MNTSQQFTMENVKQNLLIQSGNIHVNKEDKIRSKEFMEQFTVSFHIFYSFFRKMPPF